MSLDPLHNMSVANTTENAAPIQEGFHALLPEQPKALELLFGCHLFDTLKETAQETTRGYRSSVEDAVEEYRRLIAIKAYVVDTNATKINPTPLSNSNALFHLIVEHILTDSNSGRAMACHDFEY